MSVDNLNLHASAPHLAVVTGTDTSPPDQSPPTTAERPFSTVLSHATLAGRAQTLAARTPLDRGRRRVRKSDIVVPLLATGIAPRPPAPLLGSVGSLATNADPSATAGRSSQLVGASATRGAPASDATSTASLVSSAAGVDDIGAPSATAVASRQMTMEMVLTAFGALSRGIGVMAVGADDEHHQSSTALTEPAGATDPLEPILADRPGSTTDVAVADVAGSTTRRTLMSTPASDAGVASRNPLSEPSPGVSSSTPPPTPTPTATSAAVPAAVETDAVPRPAPSRSAHDVGPARRDLQSAGGSDAPRPSTPTPPTSSSDVRTVVGGATTSPSTATTVVAPAKTPVPGTTGAPDMADLDLDDLTSAISRPLASGDGTYSVTVSMHPAELGRVEAVMSLSGTTLQVALTPQTSTGHAALANALEGLKGELSREGASVNVTLGHPDAQSAGNHRSSQHPTPPSTTSHVDDHPDESPAQVAASQLDPAIIHVVL